MIKLGSVTSTNGAGPAKPNPTQQAVPVPAGAGPRTNQEFPLLWLGLLIVAGTSLPAVFLIAAGRRRLRASRRIEAAENEWKALKNDLLSNVAHELRTPLTPVKGYAKMLVERQLSPEKSAQIASHVVEAAGKLEHMIDLLLNYAQLQPGVTITTEPVDVFQVVSSTVSDRTLGAGASRVVVRGSSAVALGDPHLIGQALGELVDNALKFSDSQSLVEIEVHEAFDQVQILVADRGRGFGDESLRSMLDEFRQADSSPTREHGGLGLGLALAQRIALAHGGELQIQRRLDGGSIVRLSLPASSAMVFTA